MCFAGTICPHFRWKRGLISARVKGQHSFTLKDSADSGGACVEVLLRHEAYFIKKMRPDFPGPYGQISWSKHGGPHEAWELVKERAGFDRSD